MLYVVVLLEITFDTRNTLLYSYIQVLNMFTYETTPYNNYPLRYIHASVSYIPLIDMKDESKQPLNFDEIFSSFTNFMLFGFLYTLFLGCLTYSLY